MENFHYSTDETIYIKNHYNLDEVNIYLSNRSVSDGEIHHAGDTAIDPTSDGQPCLPSDKCLYST